MINNSVVTINENGCCALINLSTNTVNKVKVIERGTIDTFIFAMKTHPNSVPVQEHDSGTFLNLAVNDGNKNKIYDRGGIDSIIVAFRVFHTTNSTKVLEQESRTLINLSSIMDHK